MSKKMPYETTKVSIEKSQKDINELLEKYGVTKRVWASETNKFISLSFIIKKNNIEIPINVRINLITKKTSRTGKMLPEATYRLLYYYIKSRLEFVSYGLETLEEAFMSHIAIDPSRTLKDIILDQLPKMLPPKEK